MTIKSFGRSNVVEELNIELSEIKGLKNREGCILLYDNGLRIKVKTDWYRNLKIIDPTKSAENMYDLLFKCIRGEMGSNPIKDYIDGFNAAS